MRSVEMSHTNVPGLILCQKKVIFVRIQLKPTLRTPKCHVRNTSHMAGMAKFPTCSKVPGAQAGGT
jgi:hypothetical protein